MLSSAPRGSIGAAAGSKRTGRANVARAAAAGGLARRRRASCACSSSGAAAAAASGWPACFGVGVGGGGIASSCGAARPLPRGVGAAAAGKGFGAPKVQAGGAKAAPGKCPCGSGAAYPACCGRIHAGEPAPTAEALLRARFSAYRLQLVDYLVATTHPANPERTGDDKSYARAIAKTARANAFLSLKIDKEEPGPTADEAFIEFTVQTRHNAPGSQGKPPETSRERSHFLREGGRWLYFDFK
ncbi:hypothetical protein Rsub_00863 [Raphidocelis subcapitata]|uniref:YchJ-like middle NTF2-like domain-containing protein n=1 Tax=Raphidocelis subcapitata TaxID=307507 RepID=A0A2V0NL89_9CHLO|nr:hypothetical protein Rsub_00863 [Raphidocelis subcapitata]|eukprot:GBF88151.1 hypothetical protein Rsub_00863 [Raphidocelis subcapitata]